LNLKGVVGKESPGGGGGGGGGGVVTSRKALEVY